MERSGELPVYREESAEPVRRKPNLPTTTGVFLGPPGNSLFVPNSAEALRCLESFGRSGVSYRDDHPDFSPFATQDSPWGRLDFTVKIPHMTGHRRNPPLEGGRRPKGSGHDPLYDLGNFAQAENALLARLRQVDPAVTLTDIRRFIASQRLVWHECEDCETMLLIPRALHEACPHTGGASEAEYRSAYGSYYPEEFDGEAGSQ